MPSSKKDKKHGKNNGGIAAAVTKHTASQFSTSGTESNASNKSQSASDASSPPAQTPEINPTTSENGHLAISPMLDALSSTSISGSTIPSMTNEWTRNGVAGSPGNLISLMGESPPTQPSSYEDSGRLHQGWAVHRAIMTPSPASPSPPSSRRPLSYQMESNYPISATPPQSAMAGQRRSSVHSPFVHSRLGSNPPLPHQPQAHYYGAPNADIIAASQAGLRAGDNGLYFGFDTLPRSHDISTGADDVVLAGYQGGLKVYSVSRKGLDLVGSIKDIRGGVHHAKILPWTAGTDEKNIFPLVAVVVHGPVLPASGNNLSEPNTDGAASPRSTIDGGLRGSPLIDSYQTSIEVYSLQTNQLVDILLQSPKLPINTGVALTSPLFQPPPPTGSLSILADGTTLTVSSGATGECWVYTQLLEPQNGHSFACTAKIWTCIQRPLRGEVVEEKDKVNASAKSPRPQSPIISLRGRWLAYCPAAPSSQISMQAHIPVPILGRGVGVSSMTPPHVPTTSSSVDLPISDSMVNKIMRETTQELIQGAKWVGKHGMQAWNSYWNSGNPQAQQQHSPQARSPPQQWMGSRSPPADPTHFPPTHGASGSTSAKDPGLVSIIDITTLPAAASIHPLTTFLAPGGCSFLSFSPSSLMLFTASSKGDVQTVWDLLRVQYTHSSPLQANVSPNVNVGPQVRQVAQFSRMTVARIIDVAWTGPFGDQLAMVTERGTVHLLELPFSATMWPPPRRRKIAQQGTSETSEAPSSAVTIASGALGAAYQAAKPFVTRSRRGSSNNNSAVSGGTFKESAAQGGRVIAASISSSLGKTGTVINQLRHNGDNRVSLPQGASLPASACVSWILGKRLPMLFALGNGTVRKYSNGRQKPSRSTSRLYRTNRYKDMKVTVLPDDVVSPLVRKVLEGVPVEEYLDLSDADNDNDIGNTMTLQSKPVVAPATYLLDATIPQAEIETSAPYQPFHTDRRVAICSYNAENAIPSEAVSVVLADDHMEENMSSKKKKKNKHNAAQASKQGHDPSVWAFGQDIPTIAIDMGAPIAFEDDEDIGFDDNRPLPPSAMERLMQYDDQEQIVVTTRRRRGIRQGDVEESGFFEDDCEVLDFADQRV